MGNLHAVLRNRMMSQGVETETAHAIADILDEAARRIDRIDTGLALFNVPPCVLAWGWKEKPTAAREAAE